MGRRSDFERRKNDAYYTPIEAVAPLIPHLPANFKFVEPCAGDGRLVRHIERLTDMNGHCVQAMDVDPKHFTVAYGDALKYTEQQFASVGADLIITNPPWTRVLLHDMIERFSDIAPTWLLFDANWLFTKQSAPYMGRCKKIVPIGRVKWIENSKHVGKDDAMWALFTNTAGSTEFVSREA